MNSVNNKWIIWTIFGSSLFSIATPGIAIIPTILSLILALKFIITDKKILPDVLQFQKEFNNIKSLRKSKENLNIELESLEENLQGKKSELKEVQSLLNETELEYDYKLIYPFDLDILDSLEINNLIEKLTLKEKQMLNVDNIVKSTGLKGEDKKFYKNQVKQITRLFNAETSIILKKVTAKNFKVCQKQILTAFESINKIFETDAVKISEEILDIKLEKLTLIYKHQIKIEDEQILKREERERIKEENKVKKELEYKLNQIDKDIKHHNNELIKLNKYITKANSDVEKEIYIEKIKQLENKLNELTITKDSVLERQVKAQSGYVYIISNIGSFGENIFKIGVTRRLEPLERIRELSSASVPFEFDVHALIFSDNAFALEDRLHKHFKNQQVNKVNSRKEFYNINLDEIKNLIHSEYDNTVEFTFEPKAEQYRESLLISQNL
ncbi:MAG: DUF4041 domain-containing protein [Staphylococcus epidermidis]|uniref:Bacteriophage T5 Orf172 DNA-binding domain-containing protein n=1 Tax=Staphylococcus epidermidis TaxID=1282 RepID=A0AAE5V7U0_STAEP|nr:DUF4041 domain-containing protein [Staphylococcus epidermidis]MDU3987318.1 DUF4041 domain-containing protein [Staphylococcus aureus]MCG2067914.1 DUF4041 domain-containing protein [Staphylococcus epidermidis]MDH8720258.1 DUF4041 domain-containing protein [Staphylococcus epidermidis]MDH8734578.1 DUF4041 domain-containing protein [Staphylococcus epidermidis]MDH8748432.1 DUF4041 domain-containing protein [Staphylococcus epidermidis]